jgi:hypothetical protein
MKPLQRRKLLAALAAPPPADRKRAFEAAPAEAPARTAPAQRISAAAAALAAAPARVMISYRVPETGAGGDGAVFSLRAGLEARGYSVFVGEQDIGGADSWMSVIQAGVSGCTAFVVLCSPTYGDAAVSQWTQREFMQAVNEGKLLLPVWHSGAYPPPATRLVLGGLQRIPGGNYAGGYAAAGIAHAAVVEALVKALQEKGILPDVDLAPQQ